MKPMLPVLKQVPPQNGEWLYEIKYDGFRAILELSKNEMHLWSRNEIDMLPFFPEIKDILLTMKEKVMDLLPIKIDGELVILENGSKANFGQLQMRGRMKSQERIEKMGNQRPCKFLAFDLLIFNNKSIMHKPYHTRKEKLKHFMEELELPLEPTISSPLSIQYIPFEKEYKKIWDKVLTYNGEGIIAKNKESKWEEGKRSETWIKLKNWKSVTCFITAYDSTNGYYHIGVYKNDSIFPLGLFLFSLDPEQKQALNKVLRENGTENNKGILTIQPSICVEINYLEWYEQKLREPHFHRFKLDTAPEQCTYEQFLLNEANIPKEITISHPTKPIWKKDAIVKLDFIRYMREISPFMLPFLENRALTVIRYPHGIFGEPFYQKNCPDYAPKFIRTNYNNGINYIICNNLKTLMWLANQLAIEYHIPFHTIENPYVSEIVFDLDPPTRKEFTLAVTASRMMKKIFDQLNLISFVKTSGNKGLQVYIPLPEKTFTWKETRLFTEFIANYLVSEKPDLFTIERLKKNRKNRLYVDFVQHAEGKTIIAPYSMRGHEDALIASPLFWSEVNEKLNPSQFTIKTIQDRISKLGCPFVNYFSIKKQQPFEPVLNFLKNNK